MLTSKENDEFGVPSTDLRFSPSYGQIFLQVYNALLPGELFTAVNGFTLKKPIDNSSVLNASLLSAYFI